jgi:hypothetical protein
VLLPAIKRRELTTTLAESEFDGPADVQAASVDGRRRRCMLFGIIRAVLVEGCERAGATAKAVVSWARVIVTAPFQV